MTPGPLKDYGAPPAPISGLEDGQIKTQKTAAATTTRQGELLVGQDGARTPSNESYITRKIKFARNNVRQVSKRSITSQNRSSCVHNFQVCYTLTCPSTSQCNHTEPSCLGRHYYYHPQTQPTIIQNLTN